MSSMVVLLRNFVEACSEVESVAKNVRATASLNLENIKNTNKTDLKMAQKHCEPKQTEKRCFGKKIGQKLEL